MSPERNDRGTKMQAVVMKDAITPGATIRVPSTTASSAPAPSRRRAAMFSEMTMASSMIRPIAINRPTMVIMFSE